MRAHYIREQKHICGERYMEVDLFEVTDQQHRASRRAKRELATSLAQQKRNDAASRRYFVQLGNTNFTSAGWALTLTVNNEHLPKPGDAAAVDKLFTNYIRRIRNFCKTHDRELPRWMAVIEHDEVDELGVVHGRPHIHMMIEGGLSRDELEMLWRDRKGDSIGLTRCEHLELDHSSIEALTRYMLGRKRRKPSWRQSRNLKKPKRPAPNDTRWSRRQLDKAATDFVDDRAFWEKKYPGYTPNGIEADVTGNGTWHVIAKMRKIDDRKQKRGRKNQP